MRVDDEDDEAPVTCLETIFCPLLSFGVVVFIIALPLIVATFPLYLIALGIYLALGHQVVPPRIAAQRRRRRAAAAERARYAKSKHVAAGGLNGDVEAGHGHGATATGGVQFIPPNSSSISGNKVVGATANSKASSKGYGALL